MALMMPSIVVPHQDTVRTYSYITSIIKTLFGKKREKQIKHFKIMTKNKSLDSTQFKQMKNEVFVLVKDKNNKVRIAVGNNIVSSAKFDTFEQAEQYVNTKPWELIVTIQSLICEMYEKKKQEVAKTDESNK